MNSETKILSYDLSPLELSWPYMSRLYYGLPFDTMLGTKFDSIFFCLRVYSHSWKSLNTSVWEAIIGISFTIQDKDRYVFCGWQPFFGQPVPLFRQRGVILPSLLPLLFGLCHHNQRTTKWLISSLVEDVLVVAAGWRRGAEVVVTRELVSVHAAVVEAWWSRRWCDGRGLSGWCWSYYIAPVIVACVRDGGGCMLWD